MPIAMARNALTSGHIAARAMRFAIVGGSTGTIYVIVTSLLVSRLGVAPIPASVLGYCASVPASFLGHRRFTFRSKGRCRREVVRFLASQMLNIAVTMAAMHGAVAWFGGAYWWGMVAAVFLVPLTNFLINNLWVFRRQANGQQRDMAT